MSHLPKPRHRVTPVRTPVLWPGPVDRACTEGLAGVRRLACLVDRFPLAPSFPLLLLSLQADEIWMSWQCCRCAAEQAAMAPGRVMDSPDYTGPAGGGGGGTASSIQGPPPSLLQPTLSGSFCPPRSRPSRALPGSPSQRLVASVISLTSHSSLRWRKRLFCWQMRDVRPEKGRDLQSEWLSGLEPSSVPLPCQYCPASQGYFLYMGSDVSWRF